MSENHHHHHHEFKAGDKVIISDEPYDSYSRKGQLWVLRGTPDDDGLWTARKGSSVCIAHWVVGTPGVNFVLHEETPNKESPTVPHNKSLSKLTKAQLIALIEEAKEKAPEAFDSRPPVEEGQVWEDNEGELRVVYNGGHFPDDPLYYLPETQGYACKNHCGGHTFDDVELVSLVAPLSELVAFWKENH